jgi:protein-ribulosamine 3-kinase
MIASIPAAIIKDIESRTRSTIVDFTFASGGCINRAGRLTTSSAVYFLKWNDLQKFPLMFEAEAKGLSLLRGSNALKIPEVIYSGNAGAFQFLLLEYIEEARKDRNYWKRFGSSLAALHASTSNEFGLDHDNYIGSLPQQNESSSSWTDFFSERRLGVQLQIARDARKIDHTLLGKFDAMIQKLPSLLPERPPSLLHGDLWSGNVMTASPGLPCLIDPAVYYGDREIDLAMTQLFGGFDEAFLGSYQEVHQLEAGYQDRFKLYNLYPLLVHVNLFGRGYISQVVSTINRFV